MQVLLFYKGSVSKQLQKNRSNRTEGVGCLEFKFVLTHLRAIWYRFDTLIKESYGYPFNILNMESYMVY